jgi:hypothetical protein
VFVGGFRFDKREGFGILSCPNDEKYEGEWLNDRCHG